MEKNNNTSNADAERKTIAIVSLDFDNEDKVTGSRPIINFSKDFKKYLEEEDLYFKFAIRCLGVLGAVKSLRGVFVDIFGEYTKICFAPTSVILTFEIDMNNKIYPNLEEVINTFEVGLRFFSNNPEDFNMKKYASQIAFNDFQREINEHARIMTRFIENHLEGED